MVRKLYESHAHSFVRVLHGMPISWDSNTAATTRPSRIELVVWSPCDRFIAIAREAVDIMEILDSGTLLRLQTLASPQGISTRHRVLIFSPDSRILTCSSVDSFPLFGRELFVISWDLLTGGVISVITWRGTGPHLGKNAPITYSTDGKMVGVFYPYHFKTARIFICDVASGGFIHFHTLTVGILLSDRIWTHGECLRFATADAKNIVIWEVGFTSAAPPTEVETLPAPGGIGPFPVLDGFDDGGRIGIRLLPDPCRLAIASRDEPLVWDVRQSKDLLRCTDSGFGSRMSFSADGRFFACRTTGSDVYLWKDSPSGYLLHGILPSSAVHSDPLLSQNGELVVAFGGRVIQLWRTQGFPASPSSTSTRAPQRAENFVLDFSPDGKLAIVAMQKDNAVMVLDLKSGVPRFTIDAGMEVHGLRVVGNAIAVLGYWKVLLFYLPPDGRPPYPWVGPKDSSLTVKAGDWQVGRMIHASISPECHRIAFITDGFLHVCDASTGQHLGRECAGTGVMAWFAPDGCDIWCVNDRDVVKVWRVGGWPALEFLGQRFRLELEEPPAGYPWMSSCGYRVNDSWVIGPDGKRLLMLPLHWQSDGVYRVWNGRFLALLHRGLSEPVILELDP